MKSTYSIALAAVLCLTACGTPGAPRPPSLRLPGTVRDLAATRQGSTVTLSWTEPQRTTDEETIRALGPTLVCMGVNDFPMTHCDQVVADLTTKEYAQCTPQIGKPASCAITLPLDVQRENPRGQATYAVEILNTNGRSAGLSNQVQVPTAPTAPAPTLQSAIVGANAITITAVERPFVRPEGTEFQFRLFRRADESRAGEVDLGNYQQETCVSSCQFLFSDQTFQWEKTYLYRVAAVTTVHLPDGTNVDVRGDPSLDIKVFAHDTFAPTVPQGVQAVSSGAGQKPFVDLTWAPDTDADLAGYNVYRHEAGQPAAKIDAELVKTPSYRDFRVQPGKTYLYSITAVDLRNNESSKSPEASETVH